jgi:hypothetical protein
MEDFKKVALDSSLPKTPLLVSSCGWHLRHLATQTPQTETLPEPSKQHPYVHSVHHGDWTWGPPSFPGHKYLKGNWQMVLWATECTASKPTPISTSTLSLTIAHPINKLHFPHWCTVPEVFTLKTVCRQSLYAWVNIHLSLLQLLLVMANAVPTSPILVTLMMEALGYSETWVLTTATWCNIPEDGILHSHHHENHKSYMSTNFLGITEW